MQEPIDRYLATLAERLTVSGATRDTILAETRAELERHAAALRTQGASAEEAQTQAIQSLGAVRRIVRRLNTTHPIHWGTGRWIKGIVIGGVVAWAIWMAGTIPAMFYYYSLYPVTSVTPPPSQSTLEQVIHALTQSVPPADSAFAAFLVLGWLWLLPLIALYLILPALWGHHAENWWAPGLAFGLGTWLSIPWFAFYLGSADWAAAAEARIVAVALPLALLASAGGWLLRRRPGLSFEGALPAEQA